MEMHRESKGALPPGMQGRPMQGQPMQAKVTVPPGIHEGEKFQFQLPSAKPIDAKQIARA